VKRYGFVLVAALAVLSLAALRANVFGKLAPWERMAVVEFRVPRILMALMLGSGMALSGWIAQSATRNPLASPEILTVPAAASFGVMLTLWLSKGQLLSSHLLPVTAASCGIVSALGVFLCAGRRRGLDGSGLLLIGISLASLLSAGTLFIALNSPPNLYQYAIGYLTGSLARASWEYVWMLLPAWWLLMWAALLARRQVEALLFEDELVNGLGGRADISRRLALCLSAALGAVCAGVGGNFAFLGFAAPHIARRASGGVLQPLWQVAATGALLLLASDMIGQTFWRPGEVPAGIVMAVAGAPLFVLVLLRRRAIQ
jgi:iron complex transport system permease protein